MMKTPHIYFGDIKEFAVLRRGKTEYTPLDMHYAGNHVIEFFKIVSKLKVIKTILAAG